MTINLAQAFSAARRPRDYGGNYWRPAALALPMARAALAELAAAEAAKNAAERAHAAAYAADSRRYAPALVSAREAAQKARKRWDSAWDSAYPSRPVSGKGPGASLGAPFTVAHSRRPLQWCERPPFRFAGLAHDLARLDHTGYFLDPEGYGELAVAVVYQMTGKDGRARYVPAIADPHNGKPGAGPAMLALSEVVTAEGPEEWQAEKAAKDAARVADSLAEAYAESERDYREAWRAGQSAREVAAEASAAGRGYVAAIRALKGRISARHGLGLLGISPEESRGLIRAAIGEVRAACEGWQEARAAAAEARESRPSARYDSSLRAAWLDGYESGAFH